MSNYTLCKCGLTACNCASYVISSAPNATIPWVHPTTYQDELQKQIEKLRAELNVYKSVDPGALIATQAGKIHRLEFDLKLAVEALENIIGCSSMSSMPHLEVVESKIAKKALAKLTSGGGE